MHSISNFINGQCGSNHSNNFIITGAPGAGKTTILKKLQEHGESVVHEAATDVIRKELQKGIDAPWLKEGFREKIVELQQKRLQKENAIKTNQFYLQRSFTDRSSIDTITYCLMFKATPTAILEQAVQDIVTKGEYSKTVFLIENLGFCQQTQIRTEDQNEALEIEKLLKENYEKLGFDVVVIPAGSIAERVALIFEHIHSEQP